MNTIKAFIGHSFLEADADLVRTFLKFFDTIQKMPIGFEWDHAEEAEPKVLSEKVREKMRGKNTFIGICTAREKAVDCAAIEQTLIQQQYVKIKKANIETKISDWILQEIGFAVGCEMKLILLQEESVRKPGGLQGDIEYIPFQRDNPEQAFTKLLEMIRALRPEEYSLVPAQVVDDNKQSPSPAQPVVELVEEEPGDLFADMYKACQSGDLEKAIVSYDRWNASEVDATAKLINEITFNFFSYRLCGNRKAIERLEQLSNTVEIRASALLRLASCYEFGSNYSRAHETYCRGLDGPLEDNMIPKFIIGKATSEFKITERSQGFATLFDGLANTKSNEGKCSLYKAIADAYTEKGEEILRAVALQKSLEFAPDDTDLLFSSAYALSEAGISYLSMANYSTLIRFEKDNSSANNNIAVECDGFELSIKAAAHYQKSADAGSGLAMANLANRYLRGGFADIAENLLSKAKETKDPHKRIAEVMGELSDLRDGQTKEWKRVASLGVQQQQFFWAYGEARFMPQLVEPNFSGQWISNEGNMFTVKQSEQKIHGSWENEKSGERFSGNIFNRAAEISFDRKSEGIGFLLADAAWGKGKKGFIYLSSDQLVLTIHLADNKEASFLTLNRVATK